MKSIYSFLLILFIGLAASSVSAQDGSNDKVYMMNGEENVGKVIAIGSDDVKFIFAGETLEYTFKKAEINKIQFASGRTQVINDISSGTEPSAAEAGQDGKNVVAVLPFSFIGQGGSRDEKLEKKVQSDCYNILLKKAPGYKIQDPITTNAILYKHGVNSQTIEGFTPKELTDLLNTEYVIIGTITLNTKGATSTGGNYHSDKTKGNKTSGYAVGTTSTSVQYSTEVDMKVYNDKGESIFSKNHESFWDTQDAYEITLNYLVKRTPFYEK